MGNVHIADLNNDRIQTFGPCSFALVPSRDLIGFSGGARSFDVHASSACGWTVSSSQSWIHLSSAGAGIADGTVTYSVDPNPVAFGRSGSIALADQTTGTPGTIFSVTQDPAPCDFALSPTQASFSGTGGSDYVSVTSPVGCVWTAVSNHAWITVDAGSPGSGNGIVLYSVAANAGSSPRVGTMTIAGHTFTMNQDPQVPATPTNLAGAPISSTKVKLTWTDNASNETEIRVERKLGAGGTFEQIVALPTDTTVHTDGGLQRQTDYVYRVMACNVAGCSTPSSEVTVTTPALGFFIGEESDATWPQSVLNWFEELKRLVPTER